MFLILKTTDWKEEDYIKNSIVPFGWCEDNNRAIPNNEEIIAKVQTEEDFIGLPLTKGNLDRYQAWKESNMEVA